MSERDRLIDTINIALKEQFDFVPLDKTIKIADRLLANEVIVPPCKVGDIVFLLYSNNERRGIEPIRVCALIFGENEFVIRGTDCGSDIWELHKARLGKDVFVDLEDAEKALNGVEG